MENKAKLRTANIREYQKKRHYWLNIITAWYLSGLKAKIFCAKHNLDQIAFRRWLYKIKLLRPVIIKDEYKEKAKKPPPEYVEPIKFIPVKMSDIHQKLKIPGSEIDLLLPNGTRLRFGKNFDEEILLRLLVTLREDVC